MIDSLVVYPLDPMKLDGTKCYRVCISKDFL